LGNINKNFNSKIEIIDKLTLIGSIYLPKIKRHLNTKFNEWNDLIKLTYIIN